MSHTPRIKGLGVTWWWGNLAPSFFGNLRHQMRAQIEGAVENSKPDLEESAATMQFFEQSLHGNTISARAG